MKWNKKITKLVLNDKSWNKYTFLKQNSNNQYTKLIINNKEIKSRDNLKYEISLDERHHESLRDEFNESESVNFIITFLNSESNYENKEYFYNNWKIHFNGYKIYKYDNKIADNIKWDKEKEKIFHEWLTLIDKINIINDRKGYNYHNWKWYIRLFLDWDMDLNLYYNDTLIKKDILSKALKSVWDNRYYKYFAWVTNLLSVHYDDINDDIYTFFKIPEWNNILIFKNDQNIKFEDFFWKDSNIKNVISKINKLKSTSISWLSLKNFKYDNDNWFFYKLKLSTSNNCWTYDFTCNTNLSRNFWEIQSFNNDLDKMFFKQSINENSSLQSIIKDKYWNSNYYLDTKLINSLDLKFEGRIFDISKFSSIRYNEVAHFFSNDWLYEASFDNNEGKTYKIDIHLIDLKTNEKTLINSKTIINDLANWDRELNISFNEKEKSFYISSNINSKELTNSVYKIWTRWEIQEVDFKKYFNSLKKIKKWLK